MEAADVVRMIVRRSGLSRVELSRRAGFDRTTVSRWEHGDQEPSLRALIELAAAAGLALTIDVAAADDSMRDLVGDQLRLDPQQRLAARLRSGDRAATERALWWVAGRRWRVVVVGSVAGVLLGAPERPRDGVVDVVPESMLRASDVLLRAGAMPLGVAGGGESWELPHGGRVCVIARPPGTRGYADLARNAVDVPLRRAHERPRRVHVADVADLLRIATASADLVDRSRRPGLLALLEHDRDQQAIA